jgi:hypothetical protein
LSLRVKNCQLFQKGVLYLRHIISPEVVTVVPEKLEAAQLLPPPGTNTINGGSFVFISLTGGSSPDLPKSPIGSTISMETSGRKSSPRRQTDY